MSRSIRCYTVIDIFLIVLYALQYLPLLALMPLPLIGYWGARKYNKPCVIAYALFVVLAGIFGRIVLLWYSPLWLTRVLLIIVIVIELWILKIVTKFIKIIGTLTEEDRELLKHGV